VSWVKKYASFKNYEFEEVRNSQKRGFKLIDKDETPF
jgi:hypothetical protein